MLGERSDQRGLWEADRLYLDHVGRESFYGLLASLRGRLFRDADFAGFYCADNGRDSVPPSLLATALLLQSHDKVSDAEAKARADFDIRWKVALGIEVEDRPFAKQKRCRPIQDEEGYRRPGCFGVLPSRTHQRGRPGVDGPDGPPVSKDTLLRFQEDEGLAAALAEGSGVALSWTAVNRDQCAWSEVFESEGP